MKISVSRPPWLDHEDEDYAISRHPLVIDYKWVAADSMIAVQFQENVSLAVRANDVL